jgi:hypothetical protein
LYAINPSAASHGVWSGVSEIESAVRAYFLNRKLDKLLYLFKLTQFVFARSGRRELQFGKPKIERLGKVLSHPD